MELKYWKHLRLRGLAFFITSTHPLYLRYPCSWYETQLKLLFDMCKYMWKKKLPSNLIFSIEMLVYNSITYFVAEMKPREYFKKVLHLNLFCHNHFPPVSKGEVHFLVNHSNVDICRCLPKFPLQRLYVNIHRSIIFTLRRVWQVVFHSPSEVTSFRFCVLVCFFWCSFSFPADNIWVIVVKRFSRISKLENNFVFPVCLGNLMDILVYIIMNQNYEYNE